jgi:tetratricopeptide (TPR) repeat protein
MNAMHYANRTREEFERAIEIEPANKDALGDLLDYYVQAPGIVGGGIPKAEALLPRIEKVDPVGAELGKARIAEHNKQPDQAEKHFHRAIEMVSTQRDARSRLQIDLAKFLARHGRYDESDAVFQSAAKDAPNSPRIDFARAETWLQTKRNKAEARELLKKYIAANNLTSDDPSKAEAVHLLKKAEGA